MSTSILGEGEIARCLEVARETAREAGALAQRGRHEGIAIENKGEVDLVTDCDHRCEALVIERLSKAFPDHHIVGEEGGGGAQSDVGDQPVWYVDPIDGTTNFAHGMPWYAVSLGLEQGGVRLCGAVYVPENGWEFHARRGCGAYLGEHRLFVSKTPDLDRALVATGFGYDRRRTPDNNLDEFRAVLLRCQGMRRIGVASIDLAMVARGWLDAYWEIKLSPWDISAGALLVQEAGGRVSGLDGADLDSRNGYTVASNGKFHDELIAILQRVRAEREAGA
ncbi:MAG: inositol monophosphatase [Myxococcales bacterium]|nr:inositol monophosphatase [Myxococcales bacterium]